MSSRHTIKPSFNHIDAIGVLSGARLFTSPPIILILAFVVRHDDVIIPFAFYNTYSIVPHTHNSEF